MEWTLEVVQIPVADVDRSIAFYRDQVGFALDLDVRCGPMRFVQLTPHGSGCSIQLTDPSPMPAGSIKGLQVVVADVAAAHAHLVEKGVAAGDVVVLDDRDGGTMFEFSDPDGNAWVVQQIKERGERPLLPRR